MRNPSIQTPLRNPSIQTPLRNPSIQTPLRNPSIQTPLRNPSIQTPLRNPSIQTPLRNPSDFLCFPVMNYLLEFQFTNYFHYTLWRIVLISGQLKLFQSEIEGVEPRYHAISLRSQKWPCAN